MPAPTPSPADAAPAAAALARLAAALGSHTFATTLVTGSGRRARLTVTSRRAGQLGEDIYAEQGFYWWSWAERIAGVDDPLAAAGKSATY